MKALAVVLRQEIAAQRLLLLACPCLGLAALAAPLLPGATAAANATELRDSSALVLAMALSCLTALLAGATALGSDLAARRLGFFFSRPIPAAAIWAGRLGGAAVCAWGAALFTVMPVALLDAASGGAAGTSGLLGTQLLPGRVLAIWLASLPLAVLVAHVAGVVLRTRSAWLVLDLVAVVAVSVLVLATLRRLEHWYMLPRFSWLAPALAAAAVVLAAASAAQVLGGRTDPVRNHRLLSSTLSGLGVAGALAFAALAQHWIGIGPQDLKVWRFVRAAPGQSWLAVSGPGPGPEDAYATFLLQPASGRWLRARSGWIAYSADGRRAVWPEFQGARLNSPATLVRLDLDRAGAVPEATRIAMAKPPRSLVLSPNGTKVAVVEEGESRAAVYDLASGRLLAAPAFGIGARPQPVFLGEDRVRFLVTRGQAGGGLAADVMDLDLASRKLLERAALPALDNASGLVFDTRHAAFYQPRGQAPVVFDLDSGRRLADLSPPGGKASVYFLADGRLAAQAQGPAGTELTLLDGEGRPLPGGPRFSFPSGAWIAWVQPASPDLLLALELRPQPPGSGRRFSRSWQLLDLRRRTSRPLGAGLELVPSTPTGGKQPGTAPLFIAGDQLLRLDLVTGQRQAVGPARPLATNDRWGPW